MLSGPALFGLKYPSLLQFERPPRALYGVERAPSDTRFRERLDAVHPAWPRPLYRALFAQLQRGKGLEGFDYLDGRYLLSLDGTVTHFARVTDIPITDDHLMILMRGARARWRIENETCKKRLLVAQRNFRCYYSLFRAAASWGVLRCHVKGAEIKKR